jgi:hypothetical protein
MTRNLDETLLIDFESAGLFGGLLGSLLAVVPLSAPPEFLNASPFERRRNPVMQTRAHCATTSRTWGESASQRMSAS